MTCDQGLSDRLKVVWLTLGVQVAVHRSFLSIDGFALADVFFLVRPGRVMLAILDLAGELVLWMSAIGIVQEFT